MARRVVTASRPEPLLPDWSLVEKYLAARRQPHLYRQIERGFQAFPFNQGLVLGLINLAWRRDRAHTGPVRAGNAGRSSSVHRRRTSSRDPPDDPDEREAVTAGAGV